jgi:hypothetical protein
MLDVVYAMHHANSHTEYSSPCTPFLEHSPRIPNVAIFSALLLEAVKVQPRQLHLSVQL